MARLRFFVQIQTPPDRVGVFLVPQRMPYWYGAEMESAFEVQGGEADFAVGQKVRISGRLGKREVSLTTVVMEYQFGRLLEWRFQDAYGVRGTQRWEIHPDGPGARVEMLDEYELSGRIGRATDWLLTRHGVARRDRDFLARLKRLAERR